MNDKLISRILGSGELSALLIDELNKPLLMHPQSIPAAVKSLLSFNADSVLMGDSQDRRSSTSTPIDYLQGGNIAILNISGALLDREISTPCAASPVSYESIRYELNNMLASDKPPSHIIGRFNSAGGVAAGMMELADDILKLRETFTNVKFYAVVDSICYSAAFGLACAFGEIWVSKTGGVGSVGVVLKHTDASKAEEKAGLKTSYIYAGKKKILGNPSSELSEEDQSSLQGDVNTLYDMFCGNVALCLSNSVKSVKDTEASTYMGQAAIDVGFAHKLGSFNDLTNQILTNTGQEMDIKQLEAAQAKLDASQAALDSKLAELAKLESDLLTAKIEASTQATEAAKLTKHTTDLQALLTVAGLTGVAAEVIINSQPSLADASVMITEMTKNNHDIKYLQREKVNKEAVAEWDENLKGDAL